MIDTYFLTVIYYKVECKRESRVTRESGDGVFKKLLLRRLCDLGFHLLRYPLLGFFYASN